ncbi:MAG: hypothetical protein BWX88_02773 [Planctomycetes bacterium ADurb.Bin126]|nr:MAG: hypothetical protein BWX88_02773 [Planctomycetes bacterium ADurb.Bin126]HOD79942.1 hypothetical protein [Phycisphaerae bacterium]HQL73243.1 hypothetical protein [Phycisphaerae bacterium]
MGECGKITTTVLARRMAMQDALAASGKLRALAATRLNWCCTASPQRGLCPSIVKGPGTAVWCADLDACARVDLYELIRSASARCRRGLW